MRLLQWYVWELYIKKELGFCHLNLENFGQFTQEFQKVVIFEHCKNEAQEEMFGSFNFISECTDTIDFITKTMTKFMFIKMAKLHFKTHKEFYTSGS